MTNTRPKVFTGEWFSRAIGTMTWQKRAVASILIVLIIGIVVLTFYIHLTFKDYWSLDLSFENTPQVKWYYEGDEKPELASNAIHGSQSVRLGQPALPAPKSSTSRVYHEMVIPENYDRPVLSFWYQICTNDSIHYSDFRAYLITSTVDIAGTEPITAEVIKRDGYRCCEDQDTAPLAGYDLQWRTASYDLTHLKGQTVTLVFETNNLDTEYSLGIWTYVDYVQVVDAGPLPAAGLHYIYLPMTMRHYSACDWLDEGSICDCPSGFSVLSSAGQPTPAPTPRPTRPPTKVPTPAPTPP
jgi:hypothetical protein